MRSARVSVSSGPARSSSNTPSPPRYSDCFDGEGLHQRVEENPRDLPLIEYLSFTEGIL